MALAGLLLAGCSSMPSMPSISVPEYVPLIGSDADADIAEAGAADAVAVKAAEGEPTAARPGHFETTAEKYCYRTLARVDCYTQPLADEGTRRVDWFDAPGYAD